MTQNWPIDHFLREPFSEVYAFASAWSSIGAGVTALDAAVARAKTPIRFDVRYTPLRGFDRVPLPEEVHRAVLMSQRRTEEGFCRILLLTCLDTEVAPEALRFTVYCGRWVNYLKRALRGEESLA